MNPDCPNCGAGEKYVHVVVVIIYKDGREREDRACNACGHAWSVLASAKDARPATRDL